MDQIYMHTAEYARENNELDKYRESHWTTIACKDAIDQGIANAFDGMHLNKECVDAVLKAFSRERCEIVLACTILTHLWDGRFSDQNKTWASQITLPDMDNVRGFDRKSDYSSITHPYVLNGFIDLFRKKN